MRKILETEDYVPVPPMMTEDPFYRMTYIMKQEIRKHKWIEGEKGRRLTWEEACKEWIEKHQPAFEKFINETLKS
ncbi:hypothetical protein OPIT5_18360 [Opitutaceae bacterium TAV5]|nr:hypothetical protein OPIT5_18360 [Opitutaceae bacterium TAV5]